MVMNMKTRRVLFIILFTTIYMTGCWNSREINTLAISVCIGIDKDENGYKITQQIINPKAIASKRTANESPVVVYTESGPDLFELMRRTTTESPRKIYNSHLRMIVIGEELARDGIKNTLDFFARDHEFRTDFYFVVAKDTTAYEVLNTLTALDSIPGIEMFSSLKTSEKTWAPTKSIRILELVNSIIADGKNPVLTGIQITSGPNNSNNTDALRTTSGAKKLKYTNLGAFKQDKLVGWLDQNDSKGYNYITGNIKNTVGYVYIDGKAKITMEVVSSKTSTKTTVENGKPVINIKIDVIQTIAAVEGAFDVTKEENLNEINKSNEEKIKMLCEKAIYKAQNDYKTDIFGFGEVIHRQNPKLWKEIKGNWDDEFRDLKVNITVNARAKRLGQITQPFFIKEKK